MHPTIAISATVVLLGYVDKLQAIRLFLKLSETLSFKGTAAYFGVPPSTVSRSIKALEKELQVSLVERTTRQVRLTETGEWYRGEVASPLRALLAADEVVQAQSQQPIGTVRLTALPGYGELRLFSVLERFRKEHPRVVCDVEFTDRYLDLSTGDIDIALRATADPPDYLVAKRLHSNHFVLVASPEYLATRGRPRTVADLHEHSALCYRGPHGIIPWTAMHSNGERITVRSKPKLIANHGLLVRKAALAGEGIAFLPAWGVSQEIASGQLEEIELQDTRLVISTGQEIGMYLLYQPTKVRLGKVRALVDFLTKELMEP